MDSGGKTFHAARKPRSKQALATLLVLTVLVCHGAYGAMHQAMADPGLAMQGHIAKDPHAGRGHSGGLVSHVVALLFPEALMDHAGGGGAVGILAYAAALIFVSSVLLRLPITIPLRWCVRASGLSLPRLVPRATGRCPPPPRLLTLQVFRL